MLLLSRSISLGSVDMTVTGLGDSHRGYVMPNLSRTSLETNVVLRRAHMFLSTDGWLLVLQSCV